MADKNNYTTIRIKEDSRKKLELLRDGTDLTFSDIIENLLKSVEGTAVADITEIKREAIAIDLRFIDFNTKESQEYHISFQELQHSKVGDIFYAKPVKNISSDSYVNEEAEVLFVDKDSVFLRIRETIHEQGKETRVVDLIHIDLF